MRNQGGGETESFSECTTVRVLALSRVLPLSSVAYSAALQKETSSSRAHVCTRYRSVIIILWLSRCTRTRSSVLGISGDSH